MHNSVFHLSLQQFQNTIGKNPFFPSFPFTPDNFFCVLQSCIIDLQISRSVCASVKLFHFLVSACIALWNVPLVFKKSFLLSVISHVSYSLLSAEWVM